MDAAAIPSASRLLSLVPRRAGSIAGLVVLALLLVLPLIAWGTGQKFYLEFATRITILAIVASSLNFILGYGGMISFGHAAFVGIGAYCVGIPAYYDLNSGLLHLPLAIGASALFALLTGAVCLRTRGVYFIMITMAFAQMAYYFFLSLDEYGGDDGLNIYTRSVLPFIDLERPLQLFLFSYASLVVVLILKHRAVNSRFGMVLSGVRANDTRMTAIGFNTYAYRLVAYVIAGAVAGFAGALLGNFTNFITPAMMGWSRSGELMFMVILGGAGSLFGPVMGAVVILLLEEYLARLTVYWQLPFGLLLIAAVLYQRGGLAALFDRLGGRRG